MDDQDRVSFPVAALLVGFLHESTHLEPPSLDCADAHHAVQVVDDYSPRSRPSIVAGYKIFASQYWPGCRCRAFHGILGRLGS